MVAIPREKIEAFCKRWKVAELALFGSILRDDFAPGSDVDILLRFAPGADRSLTARLDMIDELRDIFRRPVDLVVESALRNPFRRHEILRTRRVIYAAA